MEQRKVKKIAVVGAGFSGATIGYQLANAGYKVEVVDTRNHIGGNCHSERDPQTGVMVHQYEPYISHTNDDSVWHFVKRFDEFMPYVNRVKATTGGRVYSLPINLLTINQFFNTALSPKEAQELVKKKSAVHINHPQTFEVQALKLIGNELYEAFFKGYTMKQWGGSPDKLPADIFKRLPLRFNYDDNYFSDKYQGIPENGYSHIIGKLLDHPNISVYLNQTYKRKNNADYDHVFYSGPLDEYFSCKFGRLGYRTLDFDASLSEGDHQGCAVMNYCDYDVPYTRICEHKHFAPWEHHEKTIHFREYSRYCEAGDIPYYPIRLAEDERILEQYVAKANSENGVTFVGRLGTYRYLDMDVSIKEALAVADKFIHAETVNSRIPPFIISPFGMKKDG